MRAMDALEMRRRVKRVALLLTVVGLGILLSTGIALAAVKVGNDRNNTIKGTNNVDSLSGRGGNDRITGLGGGDSISGGPGDDKLFGGNAAQTSKRKGNDAIRGGSGNDIVVGGFGADSLRGGKGNDKIVDPWFDKAEDAIQGGGGNDLIVVSSAPGVKDVVSCGPGQDVVEVDNSDVVARDCERVRVLQNRARSSANHEGHSSESQEFTAQATFIDQGPLGGTAPGYFRVSQNGPVRGIAPDVDGGGINGRGNEFVKVGVTYVEDNKSIVLRGFGSRNNFLNSTVVNERSGTKRLWTNRGIFATDVYITATARAWFTKRFSGSWYIYRT